MRHMQSAGLIGPAQLIAPLLVGDTLTEFDILLLQDAFICNGFHYIQAHNSIVGRLFISSFLYSMGFAGQVGCLTLSSIPLDDNVIDIRNSIKELYAIESITEDAIEQFFVEHCYYDFIWIEVSSELEAEPWYLLFKKLLAQYDHAPIIFLSFSEK